MMCKLLESPGPLSHWLSVAICPNTTKQNTDAFFICFSRRHSFFSSPTQPSLSLPFLPSPTLSTFPRRPVHQPPWASSSSATCLRARLRLAALPIRSPLLRLGPSRRHHRPGAALLSDVSRGPWRGSRKHHHSRSRHVPISAQACRIQTGRRSSPLGTARPWFQLTYRRPTRAPTVRCE